jgi:hypothetical protein
MERNARLMERDARLMARDADRTGYVILAGQLFLFFFTIAYFYFVFKMNIYLFFS